MKIKIGYLHPMEDYPLVDLLHSPMKEKTLEEIKHINLSTIDHTLTLREILNDHQHNNIRTNSCYNIDNTTPVDELCSNS